MTGPFMRPLSWGVSMGIFNFIKNLSLKILNWFVDGIESLAELSGGFTHFESIQYVEDAPTEPLPEAIDFHSAYYPSDLIRKAYGPDWDKYYTQFSQQETAALFHFRRGEILEAFRVLEIEFPKGALAFSYYVPQYPEHNHGSIVREMANMLDFLGY